ncbi:MAG: VapC toxin family PIN domain ribonuclease [Candidatus Altiarchaeales archaeon HGW-Altiarchaeales-2]|nr:MAG: VapC toxin family PIN domain ribonuclease [Candidatus Altiarchaeales archaeon HGW-Altiarchaeales-2]
MISYLIDTDWIIDFLKDKEEIFNELSCLIDEGIAISIISLAELYEGVYGNDDQEMEVKHLLGLNDFLTGVTVLEIDNKIANIFGKQRAILRKEGKLIDNFDILIAATCLSYNLTLMTNNIAHFSRIKGLKIGQKRNQK